MDRLFAYIWKHSRREQLNILAIVLVSLPFYFVSLDIPKYIVTDALQGRAFANGQESATFFHLGFSLPAFSGGQAITLFQGVQLPRLPYLLALSGLFLVLVLVNGLFKYIINMRKGALGERLLQRLRLDLFMLLLALSPEAARHIKPSEAATIIKDEVEPIGGFVGDAFVQPVFLGGKALTALLFILLQSAWLGAVALMMILVQGFVIPKLRREQLRLGKERQLQSRALAGSIGEVVGGMSEIGNHATAAYEEARVAERLERLYWIRYKLYGRKFWVKFLNNLLADLTPFMFYSIGGYFALQGSIDLGQLVAVLAAYRELPPPMRELIDWDQARLEVDVKYQQVVEQFSGASVAAPLSDWPALHLDSGVLDCQGLRVMSSGGDALLDGASLTLALGSHIAIVAGSGEGAATFADVLARRITAYDGRIRVGDQDFAKIPAAQFGAKTAFAGPEPVIFEGSIRDNILYSLRRRPLGLPAGTDARLTQWVDHAAAGADTTAGFEEKLRAILVATGLDDAVYRFGLASTVDLARDGGIETRILDARRELLASVSAEAGPRLIEPFDPARFNQHATIGENLLFGLVKGGGRANLDMAGAAHVRAVLVDKGLMQPLIGIGRGIAATMVEIFKGLPPDHFLFQRFSFIQSADLPLYVELLRHFDSSGEPAVKLRPDDLERLLSLAFLYVEPQHRLGFLNGPFEARILALRQAIAENMPAQLRQRIEVYDPARICLAAPLRDNLLFGRIAQEIPGAEARVVAMLRAVVQRTGLEDEVYRAGLEFQVGHAGRSLFPAQKMAIGLARCLIKRPEMLILNNALPVSSGEDQGALLARIRALMAGRTLLMVMKDADLAKGFDQTILFREGRVKSDASARAAEPEMSQDARPTDDVQVLKALPLFAGVDSARLKLLVFTSQRLLFAKNALLVRQGEPSDSAYVIIEGIVVAEWESAQGRVELNQIGNNSIVGELGIVSQAPRSATLRALTDVTALRIRGDVLLSLIAEFPDIALAIMRDQTRRMVSAQDRLAAQAVQAQAGRAEAMIMEG